MPQFHGCLQQLDILFPKDATTPVVSHRNFWFGSQRFYRNTNTRLALLLKKHPLRKIRSVFFKQFVNYQFKFFGFFLIILAVQGCGSHVYHFVEPGETLYSISWAYGHDYKEVAAWNGIPPPYIVKRGQKLRVARLIEASTGTVKKSKNKGKASSQGSHKDRVGDVETDADTKGSKSSSQKNSKQTISSSKLSWRWPVKGGKLIQTFDAKNPAKQGVDVKGNFGQAIYSAEAGKVVYSGGGLSHYGKLIIVKHNETYLSAYAHNKRLLVKEGDILKAGQRIAEMGNTGSNTTKLHFEIRRNGKPVNPLKFLPKR